MHDGCKQGHQLSDVVESVDVEDSPFYGRLAVGRDDAVGQLGILVTDFVVREVAVAGAAAGARPWPPECSHPSR